MDPSISDDASLAADERWKRPQEEEKTQTKPTICSCRRSTNIGEVNSFRFDSKIKKLLHFQEINELSASRLPLVL